MAEGDSILRMARRLDEALAGEIASRSARPGPRRPDGLPAAELDGRVLERVESRGKHLLLHFEGGLVLHSHLGMRGGWHALPRAASAGGARAHQAWIALTGDGAEAVNFGGSTMRIAREAKLRAGPEAGTPRPGHPGGRLRSGRGRSAACGRSHRSIELGEALLGQRLVAGIGNIFKSRGLLRGAESIPKRASTALPTRSWRPS